MRRIAVTALAGLAAGVAAGAPVPPPGGPGAYPDAPPPAHTGGFGEPTCHACHFGSPVNDSLGFLALGGPGAPGSDGGGYRPGAEYEITVRLVRRELVRGGFELSVRWVGGGRDGRQAGRLEPADGGRTAVTAGENGILYGHHTPAGSAPTEGDTVRWRLRWRAPAGEAGPVAFHAAGNAANDDASEFGDHVYTLERIVEAAETPGEPAP